MNNWISTKDRVPAPDVWVLVYSLGKVGSIGIDVASLVDDSGSWMTKGDWMLPLNGVSHWQPLPEKPEGV